MPQFAANVTSAVQIIRARLSPPLSNHKKLLIYDEFQRSHTFAGTSSGRCD
jgi:hypothetical protein